VAVVATIGSLWKGVGFDDERFAVPVGRMSDVQAPLNVDEGNWDGKRDEEKETATQQLRFGSLPRPLQVVKSP